MPCANGWIIALLILLGQYKDLVGYQSKLDSNKVVKAIDITAHIGSWNWPALAVGAGCIVLLILVKTTPVRSFADVIALVAGTLAVSLLHLDGVETIGDQSKIPAGLASVPVPHLPDFSLMPTLLPAAIAQVHRLEFGHRADQRDAQLDLVVGGIGAPQQPGQQEMQALQSKKLKLAEMGNQTQESEN